MSNSPGCNPKANRRMHSNSILNQLKLNGKLGYANQNTEANIQQNYNQRQLVTMRRFAKMQTSKKLSNVTRNHRPSKIMNFSRLSSMEATLQGLNMLNMIKKQIDIENKKIERDKKHKNSKFLQEKKKQNKRQSQSSKNPKNSLHQSQNSESSKEQLSHQQINSKDKKKQNFNDNYAPQSINKPQINNKAINIRIRDKFKIDFKTQKIKTQPSALTNNKNNQKYFQDSTLNFNKTFQIQPLINEVISTPFNLSCPLSQNFRKKKIKNKNKKSSSFNKSEKKNKLLNSITGKIKQIDQISHTFDKVNSVYNRNYQNLSIGFNSRKFNSTQNNENFLRQNNLPSPQLWSNLNKKNNDNSNFTNIYKHERKKTETDNILEDFQGKLNVRKNIITERKNSLKKNVKLDFKFKVMPQKLSTQQSQIKDDQNVQASNFKRTKTRQRSIKQSNHQPLSTIQQNYRGLWLQDARQMKKYITGGYLDQNQQYSTQCDIDQYRKIKQNFQIFEKIYNSIKQDKQNPIGKVLQQKKNQKYNKKDKKMNILELVCKMELQKHQDQQGQQQNQKKEQKKYPKLGRS